MQQEAANVGGRPITQKGVSKMVVYIDDVDPVAVEQLTLDEARMVLVRAEAELPGVCNSAHVQSLRREIAEVRSRSSGWRPRRERRR
jgi:hypothetical protein